MCIGKEERQLHNARATILTGYQTGQETCIISHSYGAGAHAGKQNEVSEQASKSLLQCEKTPLYQQGSQDFPVE
jgi:hypothetical protein